MKKVIAAVAGIVLMAGTAYAADWNFYGSARVTTFWSDADYDYGDDDDTQFGQGLQGNARIGAKVKVSDELAGRFEYGASGGSANIRLLYGEWNFGAGKLLVGQDYTPLYLPGSNQVYGSDAGLEGWGGEMYGSRRAQIKLTFGGFQLAFVKPELSYADGTSFSSAKATGDTVVMPAIQAQYKFAGDNYQIILNGGYQTFDVEDGNWDGDVTSWGLGLDASATFGAFSITAQINGGTNVGNLWFINVSGASGSTGAGLAYYNGSNEIIDNDAIGGRICIGYTFNEMFGVEVGYGYQQTEYDVSGAEDNESESYYIQFPITLAPGVYVIPELGVVDYTDGYAYDDEQKDITYFGAKWQINF